MFTTSIAVGAGIELRGSIENPNTPLSAIDEDWDDAFGVIRSESGVRITRRTALAIAAWFRGVNVISRYVAKTPIHVQKLLAGGGKERDKQHFAHRLVRRKANADMSSLTAIQVVTAHAVSEGNGYLYVRRKGNGEAMELWPLLPDRTYPVRMNGRLWYVTETGEKPQNEGATGVDESDADFLKRRRKLRAEDVIHVKGLGYDGLVGYNVVRYAAQTLGLATAGRDYGSKYFKNNAAGRVVLEAPHVVEESAAKRMLGGWRKMTEGLANAHKTAILEQGVKANVLSANAKDAQLIELMHWGDKQVALWLNLPAHMVGSEANTSYASLEQENQRFLDDALDFWFCAWEAELWDKLLTEEQKADDSCDFEFRRQALVRTNMIQRNQAYNTMRMNGAINVDEWRSLEGMNPLPDGQGQVYLVPRNLMPLEELVNPPDDPPADPPPTDPPADPPDNQPNDPPPADDSNEDRSRLRAATRSMLRETILRMLKRIANSYSTKCRKESDRDAWLASFAREHDAVIQLALRPASEAALVSHGDRRDAAAATTSLAGELTGRFRQVAEDVAGTALSHEALCEETTRRLQALPDELCDAFLSPAPNP